MSNCNEITKYLAKKVTQDINDGNWDVLRKITPALNDLAIFAHYVTFKVGGVDSYLGPIFPWDAMTLLQRRGYITSLIEHLKCKSICMLYSGTVEYFISNTPTDEHIDSIETHLAWESVWKSHKEIEVLEKICRESGNPPDSIDKKKYSEVTSAWKGNTLYFAENGIIGDLLQQLVPTEPIIDWFCLEKGSGQDAFQGRSFKQNHPILSYLVKFKDETDFPNECWARIKISPSPNQSKA